MAVSAKDLEVCVSVVVGSALVVDVVDVEWALCGAACCALVAVAVEDAFAGCGGDVGFGVRPGHCHLRFAFVSCSGREPVAAPA